jgi:hypothetical protein
MEDRRLPSLVEYFSEVQDPRRKIKNEKIVKKEADYVFSLKGNQETLLME